MKVIASHNGLEATRRAYELLATGESPLDACVAGVTLVEDDPNDVTVGYGGLPNSEGVVQLDAAVMDGLTHRAGGVAALEGIRHPAQLARLVMQLTEHALLAGNGALEFARQCGFQEENLLTEKARRIWRHWKEHYCEPRRTPAPLDALTDPDLAEFFRRYERPTGTVHVAALDAVGNLACVTSTSGLAFKLPGRVGDSPIVGAGLYVDNELGTCGSVGRGEANVENCSSFAAVELMRAGRAPREAGLEILTRVAKHAHSPFRDAQGRPRFNLQLFLLAKDGRHAGVALYGPRQIAVTDRSGTRLEECTPLFS